jgi:hypothetical protein
MAKRINLKRRWKPPEANQADGEPIALEVRKENQ